ncbi:MAG: glycosyltransferase family 1 protein [Syntrophaceae bacterium]|nr:glycosyltransferase family 1 protein [Syntrophaceae bacterium]
MIGPLEKRFIEDGIDLVYFLGPSWKASTLQRLNYISTVWDLCHRDFPEFPEVRNFGEFERRESIFDATLLRAYMVIADSEELKERLARYYGVNSERILVMPFQGMIECKSNARTDQRRDILSKYGLNSKYLFYPANFWSHKGHVRIIQALSLFRDRKGYVPESVFSGGDSGNLELVKSCAKRECLDASIRFLGFIPDEHIPILYSNSLALIMPTYFGPTNLPPLEAMSLGVPVIYPMHLKNQCGEAALYFDADDPVTLCEAIEKVSDPTVRAEFSQKGLAHHKMIAQRLSYAETEFRSRLDVFQRRLSCWSRS